MISFVVVVGILIVLIIVSGVVLYSRWGENKPLSEYEEEEHKRKQT